MQEAGELDCGGGIALMPRQGSVPSHSHRDPEQGCFYVA